MTTRVTEKQRRVMKHCIELLEEENPWLKARLFEPLSREDVCHNGAVCEIISCWKSGGYRCRAHGRRNRTYL